MEVKDVGGGKFLLNHKGGWCGEKEITLIDGEYGTDVEFQTLNGSFTINIKMTEWQYPEVHIKAHEEVLTKLATAILHAIQFGRASTRDGDTSIIVRAYDERLEPDCEVLIENP